MSLRSRPSGNASLDTLLPGGGWPLGGLIEILVEKMDNSELGLLLPALAALTRARQRVAIIGAPNALDSRRLVAAGIDLDHLSRIDSSVSDTHWSAEQYLRAGGCAAVVLWQSRDDYRQLRNLQLAAEGGTALAFVFRSAAAVDQPSPAALRIKIAMGEQGRRIEILRCRGILDA
ncbi:translesion DNA synthesis-associated protein ImuA [Dokdonella sp.]|uniref:translesion DNA synthesis-associated protein ImuA n=1 Tax=Dokdonella sp. TaxID=2291710 RepID=UPI002D7E4F35|nr:translesion DNA synthesis-associated protein ImuA [Dokdonella sp.]